MNREQSGCFVIWLHGLGDQGSGWHSLKRDLAVHGFDYATMSFPDAPSKPVACNGGHSCPSWFDIIAIPVDVREPDHQGMKGLDAAVSAVHAMLQQVQSMGYEASRIVLGGFSQGGALALQAASQYHTRLGAVVSMSSWLPYGRSSESMKQLSKTISDAAKSTPFLLCHGLADEVVTPRIGSSSVAALQKLGFKAVLRREYAGLQHSSCALEMSHVASFLQEHVPKDYPRVRKGGKGVGKGEDEGGGGTKKVVNAKPQHASVLRNPAAEAAAELAAKGKGKGQDNSASYFSSCSSSSASSSPSSSCSSLQTPEHTLEFIEEDMIQGKRGAVRVVISLPLCDRMDSSVGLDVSTDRLVLQSDHYRLELTLPRRVDAERVRASFKKKRRSLVVTAPLASDQD